MENVLEKWRNYTFPQNSKERFTGSEKPEKCSKCKGSMWITWTDSEGCEMGSRCECFEPTMARKRLRNSGITSAFRDKGFNNFDTRGLKMLAQAKQSCIDYCFGFSEIQETRHNSVLILGQVGSGKTHLTMAIANALLEHHKVGVRYMGYREEMTRLKQHITDGVGYTAMVEQFKRASVLVIDDMLKGNVTGSDVTILFEIVNYRYVNTLPVIISSEKDTRELLDFDNGIGSRLIKWQQVE